jgi:hypothetical protein
MKRFLLASVAALVGRAFMSDTVEVVTIKGKGGHPVRVNKADFDKDQASDKPTMHEHKDEAEQSTGALTDTTFDTGLPPVAAPAAPDFSGGGEVTPPVVDPRKDAVAPTVPSPNQRLVSKEGRKFFVVDGTGTKLEIDGVDKDGYKTEGDAWNAIMQLPH